MSGSVKEGITKSDLQRLKAIVQPKKIASGATVKHSGFFVVAHELYGYGKLSGDSLLLSTLDIIGIKKLILDKFSFDLAKDELPTSRVSLSEKFVNEKLGGGAVKGHRVELSALNGCRVNGLNLPLVEGMTLCVDDRFLETIQHSHIVVVENYEAFTSIGKTRFPVGLSDAIFIYRGDGDGGVINKDFFNRFSESKVIGWFDTDPSGVSIGISLNLTQFLLPRIDTDGLNQFGRRKLFDDQYTYWKEAKLILPSELIEAIEASGRGLTQEAVIANDIELYVHTV
ncbi:conserved hypothetical protein [Vibrio chagasii]|nr:conserved hypothetical protein [Vibrio chagasii]